MSETTYTDIVDFDLQIETSSLHSKLTKDIDLVSERVLHPEEGLVIPAITQPSRDSIISYSGQDTIDISVSRARLLSAGNIKDISDSTVSSENSNRDSFCINDPICYLSEEETQERTQLNQGELKILSSKTSVERLDSLGSEKRHVKKSSLCGAQFCCRVKNIHTIKEALWMRKTDEFETKGSMKEMFVSHLQEDLGCEILRKREYVQLTQEQETNLSRLKQRIKLKNDIYFRDHPEIELLFSLVYKQLFQHLPVEPVRFVADYIHYLNTHREAMILEPDLDVPFDKHEVIQVTSENKITEFARELVERCASIASRGNSYVSSLGAVDSLLHGVIPSKIDITSIESAINVVSDILTSLITSVVETRTRNTEIFTREIVEKILENICPSVGPDSKTYLDISKNVDGFVSGLVDSLLDNDALQNINVL